MASNFARPSTQKAIPLAEAKAIALAAIQNGATREQAAQAAGRSLNTFLDWVKKDPEFRAARDSLREAQAEIKETGRPTVPDFDVFCRDYLKQPLSAHQLKMWDVIEGRKPRDMHDSMGYREGYPQRVLINVPPDHAKTTTFSVNYSVYLIHKDPDIRIVIMSQGRELASRILSEIKFKLTSPQYMGMHQRFAPEGGWKDPDNSWSATAIYVRGKGGDKDPTVQALGFGSQIYGTRSDVIFMDDTVTTKNAREIDKQMILLDREIESRLPPEQEGGGLLAILGTRVASMDLYRTLRDVEDGDDQPVWTHFRMPAVLDYGDGESATWTTLWPERYNGPSLARRKRKVAWNLIYQQLDVDDEMTFKVEAVEASINKARFPGPMTGQGPTHRERGMQGLYMVGGWDPAATGNTAMIVAGLDPATGKRWILDGWNKKNATANEAIAQYQKFTTQYHLNEWVIERNAVQRFITQIPQIGEFARSHSCKITPHYTTSNKFDSDMGIQTMAPLFDSCGVPDPKLMGRWRRTPDTSLIDLPSQKQNAWVSEMVEQLTTWQPDGMTQRAKTDLVMALWFTHIAFMKIINRSRPTQTHVESKWLSQGARKRQGVVDLGAIRRERQDQRLLEGA